MLFFASFWYSFINTWNFFSNRAHATAFLQTETNPGLSRFHKKQKFTDAQDVIHIKRFTFMGSDVPGKGPLDWDGQPY